jgi:transposase
MKGTKNLDAIMVLRRRAIELYQLGKSQSFIVEATGLRQPTISRYIKAYKERGGSSLERPKIGGSKRMLSAAQLEELVVLLEAGSEANGYEDNLWTRNRVRQLIEDKFNVVYKVRSVGDLLRDLGFTLQTPDRRSYRQDPELVKQWTEVNLPALKKKPKKKDIR